MRFVEILEVRRLFSGIDLRVDSFNTDRFAQQTGLNHSFAEDAIEDAGARAGKVVSIGGARVPVTVDGATETLRFSFSEDLFTLWTTRTATPESKRIKPGMTYPAGTLPSLLYVQAIRENAVAGSSRLAVEALAHSGVVSRDAVRFTLIKARAIGDTNRDGVMSELDDRPSNLAARTSAEAGALVLPNLDKDNLHNKTPDNWVGGDWDADGVLDPSNDVVDDATDAQDLGAFRLSKLGPTRLPDGMKITLSLRRPAGEHAFFSGVLPQNRVRVFLSDSTGSKAVLGPEAGASVEFVTRPTGSQKSSAAFAGRGTIKLFVEGIEQGAAVDVVMTVWMGQTKIVDDPVRFRVAPFVLIGHDQRVARTGPTVAVTKFTNFFGTDLNKNLRDTLGALFGENLIVDTGQDPWIQDGYEVGYAQVPGRTMPVALELVRARDRDAFIKNFLRNQLLRPGFGVNTRILNGDGALDFGSQDMGGNIEVLPNPGGRDFFFHGAGMFDEHRNFFLAQNVNPELEVDVSWLVIGHVDEVVSVVPDRKHVAVADSELAYALLLWARQLDPDAKMSQGMNENVGPDGISVTEALEGSENLATPIVRDTQVGVGNRVHDGLYGLREAASDAMGLSARPPVTTPARASTNAGEALLDKAGVFTAWLDGKRWFRVRMTSASTYRLDWRDIPTGPWQTSSATGSTSRDMIFPDARAYLFSNWWNEGAGDLIAGDRFTFKADPRSGVIPIPVAFGTYDFGEGPRAFAFTSDHINALVDGDTIVTARAFGPRVDWNGDGTSTDILQDYVNAAYGRVYQNVVFADARGYHNGIGSVHCGTNVQRRTPTTTWWTQPQPSDVLA